MKPLLIAVSVSLLSLSSLCAGVLDDVEVLLKKKAPKGAQVMRDHQSVWLVYPKAKLMNAISLPVGWEEERLWKQFSRELDFIVRVEAKPALTNGHYQSLMALRERMYGEELKRVGVDLKGGLRFKADSAIMLPVSYDKIFSYYVSGSDSFGRHYIRPNQLQELTSEVRKLVLEKTNSYEPKEDE